MIAASTLLGLDRQRRNMRAALAEIEVPDPGASVRSRRNIYDQPPPQFNLHRAIGQPVRQISHPALTASTFNESSPGSGGMNLSMTTTMTTNTSHTRPSVNANAANPVMRFDIREGITEMNRAVQHDSGGAQLNNSPHDVPDNGTHQTLTQVHIQDGTNDDKEHGFATSGGPDHCLAAQGSGNPAENTPTTSEPAAEPATPYYASRNEGNGVPLPRVQGTAGFDIYDEEAGNELAMLTLDNLNEASDIGGGPNVTDGTNARLQNNLDASTRPGLFGQRVNWAPYTSQAATNIVASHQQGSNIWENNHSVFLHGSNGRNGTLLSNSPVRNPWNSAPAGNSFGGRYGQTNSTYRPNSAGEPTFNPGYNIWAPAPVGTIGPPRSNHVSAVERHIRGGTAAIRDEVNIDRPLAAPMRNESRTEVNGPQRRPGFPRTIQVEPSQAATGPRIPLAPLGPLEPRVNGSSEISTQHIPAPVTRLSPTAPEFLFHNYMADQWISQAGAVHVPQPVRQGGHRVHGAHLIAEQMPGAQAPFMRAQVTTGEPMNYRRLLDRNMIADWKAVVDRIVTHNDQQASIFLQQKLKSTQPDQKAAIVDAIIGQCFALMTNRFGNFLVQRCFEHGTPDQVIDIANAIRGNTITLATDPFGCHVVQRAFDSIPEEYRAALIHDLLCAIPETIMHRYACHVWQKLLEIRWTVEPPKVMIHVNHAMRGRWHEVALGETGSLVVQNIFENCIEDDKRPCIEEVLYHIDLIAQGQFGNWCIQHICEHGDVGDRQRAVDHVLRHALSYSTDQYASKVVEKCLKVGGNDFLNRYIDAICTNESIRPRAPIVDIAADQFGNYLIQWVLEHATSEQRDVAVPHIRRQLVSLRGSRYGSRVASMITEPPCHTRAGLRQMFAQHYEAPAYGNFPTHRQHYGTRGARGGW